ncbi:DNA-binding response regulator [Marinobacterium zhoushanense]|uniref:DNA-binding response regulator n=1 Tax=Marinobacterium zhoushanense TaxID=1679163 RepID=A0ABQ1KKS3_9GAMM|nr:response regulator [Marinobacterium zhoushanense]GGB98975.1 DNA-binding response regulator [Marinobacterium zhoushanense]
MNNTPHILVVDDHQEIRDLVANYLEQFDFRVTTARDGQEMKKILEVSAIDLIVLDLMMPGEDGLSLCRQLRESSQIPIIMVTAMAEQTDRVVGLEMGADDYLTKPFFPRELLARIKAVLRRAEALPRQRDALEVEKLSFDRWVLDVARRELVGEDGVAVPLSTAEFKLLSTFLAHPHRVLSREQLLDLTSGRQADVFDRSIDNQVSRLRRKIERDSTNPELIKTVWGGGYMLTVDVQ